MSPAKPLGAKSARDVAALSYVKRSNRLGSSFVEYDDSTIEPVDGTVKIVRSWNRESTHDERRVTRLGRCGYDEISSNCTILVCGKLHEKTEKIAKESQKGRRG
jgi:hypothetical protein